MPLIEDRAQLLVKYGPYVRSIAGTVRRQFGARLELDDLVSYGNLGLFEASQRFDARMGANFLTFAHYRIKGAIFDGLRKMGVLKGPDQRSAYLSERSASYLASGAACDDGRPSTFSDDVREVEGAVASLATILAAGMEGLERLEIRDESLGPEERVGQREMAQRVVAALERLPENERRLLVAYYFENKTLEEAGAVIGQSKSWSSRLHARAIDRLRDLLDEESESASSQGAREAVPPGPANSGALDPRRPTAGPHSREKRKGSSTPC